MFYRILENIIMSLRSVLKLTTPVRAWVVFVGRVVDWSGLLFDSLGTSKRGSTIACNAELAYDYHLSFIFCCLLFLLHPQTKVYRLCWDPATLCFSSLGFLVPRSSMCSCTCWCSFSLPHLCHPCCLFLSLFSSCWKEREVC